MLTNTKNECNRYELNGILKSVIVTPKDELKGTTYVTRKAGTTGVKVHSSAITVKISKNDVNTALKTGAAVAGVYIPYKLLRAILAILIANNVIKVNNGIQFDIDIVAFKQNMIPIILNPFASLSPAVWAGITISSIRNVKWQ